MTIGQLAKAVGKSPRALRLYEEKGLISPDGRSEGGFRQYGPDALLRLRWILRLVNSGLNLGEVQSILQRVAAAENGREALDILQDHFQQKIQSLDEQIKQLSTLKNALESGLNHLKMCDTCEKTRPHNCNICVSKTHAFPEMIAGALVQSPVTGGAK
ncbi:MerR family transcriptional regulator [Myxococcota bacterium]|nr:MerR family transcriptional regulator [Myxococcota bacterium]MBU1898908.1 MerR family transcriptional regulator [Myxococcota bacterium]